MSEIYLPSEVRDLPSVQFRSAGVVYDPTPAPTATQVNPDNSTTSLTLTKQGATTTTRFLVEDFTIATPDTQLEVRYVTTDGAADIAEFVEYVSVLAAVAAAPSAASIRAEIDSNSTQLAKLGTPAGASISVDIATLDNFVDTEVAALLVIAQKLDTALELDGAVYRFTLNALELAPGGAGSDPLLSAVPGAYAAGTAGYNIGLIDDILADTSAFSAVEVTLTSPVREVGGEQEIELVQGASFLIALGTSIDIAFTGLPDTTGASVATLTITDKWGEIVVISTFTNPITGTLGTWTAGAVTARFEMSAAQSALLTARSTPLLEKEYRWQCKIVLAAAAGTVIPVPPKTGKLIIKTQAHV